MTRVEKILSHLNNASLNVSGAAAESVLREELKGAFRMGWKAQRDHGPNSLQAEEGTFARFLDEEV